MLLVPLVALLARLGPAAAQDERNDGVCFFGGEQFLPGENLGGAFETRCGPAEEWPCFCNPELEGNAECPYCGFAAGNGDLFCARDGGAVVFRDGSVERECSCSIPVDPSAVPITSCTVREPEPGCVWPDANGEDVFFEDGESFGDLIDGTCGPAAEWPSFCGAGEGQDDFVIVYPYCVFSDTATGRVVCAEDGERVSYNDNAGTRTTCDCSYTPGEGADPTCVRESQRPTQAPAPSPPTSLPAGSGGSPRPAGGAAVVVPALLLAMMALGR